MDSFEALAIEETIKSQVGRKSTYNIYDRSTDNPMNFVLGEAERQLSEKVIVYWVNGGLPENFSLPGFEPMPLVYNSRYIEIAYFIRKLIVGEVDDWLSTYRLELSERICLRLMAELSLRYGNDELAVPAFLKSIIGQGIHIPTTNLLDDLEIQPRNEAYMVTWFFGLAHEIGHAFSIDEKVLSTGLLSDESIESALDEALQAFPYPDDLKRKAKAEAISQRSRGPIGIDHLCAEALADIFAVSVLFHATINFMQNAGNEFDLEQFVAEVTIFFNIMVIIERCKQSVIVTPESRSDPTKGMTVLLSPVSFHVRALLFSKYLRDVIAARLSYPNQPSQEILDGCTDLISNINSSFVETLDEIERGMARAMRFALFPEEREPDLLVKFAKEASQRAGLMALIEGQEFCDLADSFDVQNETLQSLQYIVENPGEGNMDDSAGDLIFIVPWVKGPKGFDQPFGLDTKYGHLVFVFLDQGEAYDAYFDASAESLLKDYTLETAAVGVPSTKQLSKELAASMPSGMHFGVVVEGTGTFSQLMEELADDTIWPNE